MDIKLAAQTAIFAALNVPELTALTPVFQHVPDDREPPMTILGDMRLTPLGGKDGGLDRLEFDILTVVRRPGREFLSAPMAKARELLEGQALAAPGAEMAPPVFESDDDELLEDGVTYLGTQRFSSVVQQAD